MYKECCDAENNGRLSSHTNCFVISGSKVLEGVGSYVVIAFDTKSFNGRIMMGMFYYLQVLVLFYIRTNASNSTANGQR